MNIREQVLRALLKAGRPVSPAGLAGALRLSRMQVQKALSALARRGEIEHPVEGVYRARKGKQRRLIWRE